LAFIAFFMAFIALGAGAAAAFMAFIAFFIAFMALGAGAAAAFIAFIAGMVGSWYGKSGRATRDVLRQT